MSPKEVQVKYSSMPASQLRDLLNRTKDPKEAEKISQALQRKRESELLAKADKVKARPPAPAPSGDCFIATACYKDADHPHVIVFRKWRDCELKSSFWGRVFIQNYYFFAPYISTRMSRFPSFTHFLRVHLLEPLARRLMKDSMDRENANNGQKQLS